MSRRSVSQLSPFDPPEVILKRRYPIIRVFRNMIRQLQLVGREKPDAIQVPKNTERIVQLQKKLRSYYERYDLRTAPREQMDTICKIRVLVELLTHGHCRPRDLEQEMCPAYGDDFDHEAFENACLVINDYCSTGGQMVRQGEGLPQAAN
ncbi:hypothetical protein JW752_01105 [Candidatus Peregrinibacteria bacterium]|nr:hypothetical protein [Candidatus Peregrinibacteria bacterium]